MHAVAAGCDCLDPAQPALESVALCANHEQSHALAPIRQLEFVPDEALRGAKLCAIELDCRAGGSAFARRTGGLDPKLAAERQPGIADSGEKRPQCRSRRTIRIDEMIRGTGAMQSPLQVRCLLKADAPAYYALRLGSLEGLRHPVEPEVLGELGNGIGGLAERLVRYEADGTRVWGVFDRATLAGVAAATLTPLLGDESADLWGVFVVHRYRGTAVSRFLMDAVFACCEHEWKVRAISSTFASGNAQALQFLRRFGFELRGHDEAPSDGSAQTMIRVFLD